MQIRVAEYADVEPLRDYAAALFAERLPGIYDRAAPSVDEEIEFVRSHAEPENAVLLVAEEDERIVGLLGFIGRQLAEERHAGEFGLSVAEGHRGAGIGSALIEGLVSWAPQHGVSRIECRCWANNPDALRLYRRMGLVQEGLARRAIVRDGEEIDVCLLARLLP